MSGFGAYLAIPLIRERWSPDMEEGEARALLEDCLRVLFYRCATYMHTYIFNKKKLAYMHKYFNIHSIKASIRCCNLCSDILLCLQRLPSVQSHPDR